MTAIDLAMRIYSNSFVQAILGLMAANVLVGIAGSLYFKEFRLAALGDWLLSRAVPYLIGAGAVQLVLLTVPDEWSGLSSGTSTAVWLFVILSLVGKILDTLRQMGLPIPQPLGDRPKPQVTATP